MKTEIKNTRSHNKETVSVLNLFNPGFPFGIDETKRNKGRYTEAADYTFNSKIEVNAFDVASYILSKTGEITTMKLQKLLYYCQAWSLVWDDKPLFKEEIEAWANGPVVRTFFTFHRGQYSIGGVSVGNMESLTTKNKETIDSVLNFYGDKTTQWLVELSHMEDPWKIARKGLLPMERGENIITLESMYNYYSSL